MASTTPVAGVPYPVAINQTNVTVDNPVVGVMVGLTNPGGTGAPTGVSASGTVGQTVAAVSDSNLPTGVTASGQIGTLIAFVQKAITGAEASGQSGNTGFEIIVPLQATSSSTFLSKIAVGVAATGRVGSLTTQSNYSVTDGPLDATIIGVEGVGHAGNLTVDVAFFSGEGGTLTPLINGVTAHGQVGTVLLDDGIQRRYLNLIGLAAHGLVGALGIYTGAADVSGQAGNLFGDISKSVDISGAQADSFVAQLAPQVSAIGEGQSATGTCGSVAIQEVLTLAGTQGTGTKGSVIAQEIMALGTQSATGTSGSVAIQEILALSGAQGSGAIGSVTINTSSAGQTNTTIVSVAGISAVGSLVDKVTSALTGIIAIGSIGNQPSLNLSFLTSTLDPRISFIRAAGPATYFDSTGTLQLARSNIIRNSTFVGAVVGTPGTVPTSWSTISPTNGLSYQIVAISTIPGNTYIDYRVFGTTSGAGTFTNIGVETVSTLNAASNGQTWTGSVSTALVAGSFTNVIAETWGCALYTSASVYLGELATRPAISTTGTLAQTVITGTITTGGTTASIYPYFQFTYTGGGGQAIDFTLRISQPQLELGATATAWIATIGVVNGAPRFDYDPSTLALRGLLIEFGRTNSIRNNTMVGSASGTPGTPPTNWTTTNNMGLSITNVGTGTESGITYVDYRFFGTTSGGNVVGLFFETSTAVAASTAQAWTLSTYYKLAGGSLTNVTSTALGIDENTGAGVFVRQNTGILTAPTTAGLATQRGILSATLSGGGTVGAIGPWIRFNIAGAGLAIDFTIRVGLPQLELGVAVTSVIPTSTVAVVRQYDNATMPSAGWCDPTRGTLVLESMPESFSINQFQVTLNDSTNQNEIRLYNPVNAAINGGVVSSNTSYYNYTSSGSLVAVNTTYRAAIAWTTASASTALNGTVLNTASVTGPLPNITTLCIGQRTQFVFTANSWLRRISYYPQALSSADLVLATAGTLLTVTGTPVITNPLAGVSATGAATGLQIISASITGTPAAGTLGSLTHTGTVDAISVSATCTITNLGGIPSSSPSSVSCIATIGTMSEHIAVQDDAAVGTGYVGSIATLVTQQITGVSSVAQVGNLSVLEAKTPTSVAAHGDIGILTTEALNVGRAIGNYATGNVGIVRPSVNAQPIAVTASAATGNVTSAIAKAITGVVAIASTNPVTSLSLKPVNISGVAMTGEVNVITFAIDDLATLAGLTAVGTSSFMRSVIDTNEEYVMFMD